MKNNQPDHQYSWGSKFIDRHPVIANLMIIIIITFLGIYATYLATALFTKHGRSMVVPSVENMTYTEAISKLHDAGLSVDIRDSLYRDDIKPGFVIEQYPRPNSIVKPGRKVFLYINSVNPRQVIIDDDNHPNELALKGLSLRSAEAKFKDLGFRNIKVVRVLGASDRVVKALANGRPIRKMQKVPVNASIILEVSDGRLGALQDSLSNLEYLENYQNARAEEGELYNNYDQEYTPDYTPLPKHNGNSETNESEPEENNQYF